VASTYNIFISHSWVYGDAYNRLIELLNGRGYFPFKNYSVPKNNPIHNAPNQQALYNAILNQIQPSSVILIMAGVYATYSKWINLEIQIAKKEFINQKPIIAIKPWGQTNISSVVSQNANDIVGWNTESVVAAIRKWTN
jgi:hypothetical protein